MTCQLQNETAQDQKVEIDSRQSPTLLPSAPTSTSPYEPLSQHCTRLVTIETAKNYDDPIICNLSKVSFGEKPQFDALSYTWGVGPAQCNISLNGVAFSVRQNLMDVLRYLRAHAPDTSYWIDAICINQDDVLERNKQVRIMHHIYSRAKAVVVWLGKRYAEYGASLADLHRLDSRKQFDGQLKLESSPDQPQSDVSAAKLSDESIKQREMAIELYNNGYWSRLWIIQEIGQAREIKVCFGNWAIEWSHFIHFLTMLNVGHDGPLRLNRQRQEKYTGSGTLLHLLQEHKGALCEDSKDKVYGLVGLALDARGFNIDYEKSTFEIWTDVMEFMNKHDLFSNKNIVGVGDLVKSLLMGPNCPPLQQILRPYTPGKGDSMILTDINSCKVFKLQAALLGCVICVGPHPNEIVGNLSKVDEWKEQVQANYKADLGRAHQESDMLVQAILELDDVSLSKKCPDYRSRVQWSADHTDDFLVRIRFNIQALQSEPRSQFEHKILPAEQTSTDSSRLFQMLDSTKGQSRWKMGLASSDIHSGDLICWLEWPRRAVVVRPYQPKDIYKTWKLQIMGTAVVTEDLGESSLSCSQRPDWFKNKLSLEVYLDASTIFILLA